MKSLNMNELYEFCSRMFSITSNELNEMKSFSSEVISFKDRHEFDLKKITAEYDKILSPLIYKKPNKYFPLIELHNIKINLLSQIRLFEETLAQI